MPGHGGSVPRSASSAIFRPESAVPGQSERPGHGAARLMAAEHNFQEVDPPGHRQAAARRLLLGWAAELGKSGFVHSVSGRVHVTDWAGRDRRGLLGPQPGAYRGRYASVPARVALRPQRGSRTHGARELQHGEGHQFLRRSTQRPEGRRGGRSHPRRQPLRNCQRGAVCWQACTGREAAHGDGRRRREAHGAGRGVRPDPDVRSHLLLHPSRTTGAGTHSRRRNW